MSYDLVDAAFYFKLPGIEKDILLALCKHAHADGTGSYASLRLLAFESGFSVRSVQNALRSLEAKNIIVAEGSKTGGRKSQTVHYKILLPNADMVAAVKSTWKRTGAPPAPDGAK